MEQQQQREQEKHKTVSEPNSLTDKKVQTKEESSCMVEINKKEVRLKEKERLKANNSNAMDQTTSSSILYPRKRQRVGNAYQAKIPPYTNSNSMTLEKRKDKVEKEKGSIRWIRSSLLQQQKEVMEKEDSIAMDGVVRVCAGSDNPSSSIDHGSFPPCSLPTSSPTSQTTATIHTNPQSGLIAVPSNNHLPLLRAAKDTSSCICVHKAANNAKAEELISHITQLFPSHKENNNETQSKQRIQEEDIASFLQSKHHGNIEAATLDVQVYLSGGKATNHCMLVKKRLKRMLLHKSEKATVTLTEKSMLGLSWRGRYRVMYDSCWNRLYGDLRHDRISDDVTLHPTTSSWEDLQIVIDDMYISNTNNKDSKPSMESLSTLLHKAYHCPPPNRQALDDTTSNKTHVKLHSILDLISRGRDYLARVLDAAYTASTDSTMGLTNIKSELETAAHYSPVLLTEVGVLQTIVNRALEWEQQVQNIEALSTCNNTATASQQDTLTLAELLLEEAHTELNIFPTSIIHFKRRVEKAQDLRMRIQKWNRLLTQPPSHHTCHTNTSSTNIRMLSSFVKELHKIGLSFHPESHVIQSQHRHLDDWMERATRAKMIIQEGTSPTSSENNEKRIKLPFCPDDIIDKLKSKQKIAHDWVTKFQCLVIQTRHCDDPTLTTEKGTRKEDKLTILSNIRQRINTQDPDLINKFTSARGALIHLFNEGLRIPVDISEWNLLKFELDAFDWSFEAKKLFLKDKKLKMEDVLDLLQKAKLLRDKLPIQDKRLKEEWVLEYEGEWGNVITCAEDWLTKTHSYLGDTTTDMEENTITTTCDTTCDTTHSTSDTLLIINPKENNIHKSTTTTTSIIELRDWYIQGDNLSVHLGNPFLRLQKIIIADIQPWLDQYSNLLLVCHIISSNDNISYENGDDASIATPIMDGKNMTLTQISTAISSAPTIHSSTHFTEVLQLQTIQDQIQLWSEHALTAVPFRQRSKRSKVVKSQITTTVSHLRSLLEESSKLPPLQIVIDDKARLEQQLQVVLVWQLNAQCDLRSLMDGIHAYVEERDKAIEKQACKGLFISTTANHTLTNPHKITSSVCASTSLSSSVGNTASHSKMLVGNTNPTFSTSNEPASNNAAALPPSSSTSSSSCFTALTPPTSSSNNTHTTSVNNNAARQKVCQVITSLLDSALHLGISTIEESIAEYLDTSVIHWCCRVANILPFEVLQKCNFEELDEIISQGRDLLLHPTRSMMDMDDVSSNSTNNEDLKSILDGLDISWMNLVQKELARLDTLRSGRNNYFAWVKEVESFLSSSEKVTLPTLNDLLKKSRQYPPSLETVRKLKKEVDLIDVWTKDAQLLLFQSSSSTTITTFVVSSSHNKISMDDAKGIVSKGEKLRVIPIELKTLKLHLRLAKNWATKVKNCSVDKLHFTVINKLLEEHDSSFIIYMAEDVTRLKSLVKEYCICRKPYYGFMICCDICEEWFHGSCVGVSSAQAERVQKYRCVRCCIVQTYKDSYTIAFEILNKWKNTQELKVYRRTTFQKHQQKIHKERRDIEMKTREAEIISHQLMITQQNGRLRTVQSMSPRKQDENLNHTNNMYCSSITDNNNHHSAVPKAATSTHHQLLHNKGSSTVVVTPNITDTSTSNSADHSSMQQQQQNGINTNNNMVVKSIEEAKLKLENIRSHLVSSSKRLERLLNEERCMILQITAEDKHASSLYPWFHRVLTCVLVPSTMEEANQSRPKRDGTLSEPMQMLRMEAQAMNIIDLHDVVTIFNSFINISWCLRALDILCLSRRPLWEEMDALLHQSKDCRLPDEKGLRILRGIAQRSFGMKTKVKSALAPIPGEIKPYDLKFLSELHFEVKNMPIVTLEESMLVNTIEDKGTRHCICGGASDGRFMICCDKCDLWFHGDCVQQAISNTTSTYWLCPTCSTLDAVSTTKKKSHLNTSIASSTTSTFPTVKAKICNTASLRIKKIPQKFNDNISTTDYNKLKATSTSSCNELKTQCSVASTSPHNSTNTTIIPITTATTALITATTLIGNSTTNSMITKIPNAPDPDKLWPPIGLLNSSLAEATFGCILKNGIQINISNSKNGTTTYRE